MRLPLAAAMRTLPRSIVAPTAGVLSHQPGIAGLPGTGMAPRLRFGLSPDLSTSFPPQVSGHLLQKLRIILHQPKHLVAAITEPATKVALCVAMVEDNGLMKLVA